VQFAGNLDDRQPSFPVKGLSGTCCLFCLFGQTGRTAAMSSAGSSRSEACLCSFTDYVPLEFGKGSEDVEGETIMRGGGIDMVMEAQ
jgi:hypothetical protein